MASRVCFLLHLVVILQIVWASEYKNEGLIDRLNNGMKHFLGSESVALKVAEFVVRAFQTANNPTTNRGHSYNGAYVDKTSDSAESEADDNNADYNVNEAPNPMAPLRHLVRLFGLQPTQIGAVAVNALVFVAQMISTFLAGPKRPSRPQRNDNELKTWILNKNSRKLQELIETAKNESFPNLIEDIISEQGSEEEISCIRLLVCKVTPFVVKMQKVVFGNDVPVDNLKEKSENLNMYRHLPSTDEINDRSDLCEQRHKNCDLNE